MRIGIAIGACVLATATACRGIDSFGGIGSERYGDWVENRFPASSVQVVDAETTNGGISINRFVAGG